MGFCEPGLRVVYVTLPHSVNHNSVTQPHLTAEENGVCALAVCHGGKVNRQQVVILSHKKDLGEFFLSEISIQSDNVGYEEI